MTDFRITQMEKADIPAVAELEKENFSEPWSENSISQSLQHNTVFFTAKSNEKLIGYIGLNFVLDEGYITSVATHKNFRNKGVATALINECVSFADSKNLAFISLEVRASNEKAINLYSKTGFIKEGLRKNFYRLPVEDAIIMTRRFVLKNADTRD